ncbi:hypothetical protein DDE82_007966 [Stemphylium lycopersici]|uniref:Uncharacterized protein n=1 Tax=Stemphylium lycopersici TaxID=183478 RepID=A0A364MZP0_STELY|nr:hypothetical protein TW65_07989 [Stemphylium lycopersici]RAQ99723.1 hypothetical protein DDE82_007966 [Stemphylium lycopersici]RAR08058.1 hypothetical protein DDE83_006158 [Stemphylium lycopersici]
MKSTLLTTFLLLLTATPALSKYCSSGCRDCDYDLGNGQTSSCWIGGCVSKCYCHAKDFGNGDIRQPNTKDKSDCLRICPRGGQKCKGWNDPPSGELAAVID